MKDTLPDDEDEDFDGTEAEYHPEADDAGELACPKCGASMYGDATRCSQCGDYVTPGESPGGSLPLWMWIAMILIGAAFLAGIIASLS